MTPTLYGIPNCDTVKKARSWLDAKGITYAFHDYKKAGIDASTLSAWCNAAGWERVLNRAGTTFRKLPDAAKIDIDEAKALTIMQTQPSCIKRPIITHDGVLLIGFHEAEWAAALG